MNNGISLRTSLTVLVLATALPFVALIAYDTYSDAQLQTEQAGAEALRAAQTTATEATSMLQRTRELLSHLSEQPAVRSLDPENCDLAFKSFGGLFPQYTNLVTVRSNGDRVCSAARLPPGAPSKIDPQIFLAETVRTRAFTIGVVMRGVFSGHWILAVAHPVMDEHGEIRGAVSLPVDLARLQLIPHAAELPPLAIARIVDASGMVIGSSVAPEEWIGRNFKDVPWFRLLEPGRATTRRALDVDGVERIFGAVPIEDTTWHAVVGIPAEVVYGPVRKQLMLSAAISLVALLLTAALGYLIARRIAGPVEAVAAAAREAMQSTSVRELTHFSPPFAPREVLTLARDFQAMQKARLDAEMDLRESEKRFRQIAENIRDVFFLVDAKTNRRLYVSPAYEEIWGRSLASHYADPNSWMEAIHPDDRERVRESYLRGLSAGSFEYEYRIVRPDGSVRRIQARGFPIRHDSGELYRIAGIASDVTERTQLQDALQEREAGLRRAQLMAKLAHVITGPDGSFESWSDTLPPLIGLEPARMPRGTREWLDILHLDDRTRFHEVCIEAATKGARADVEYRLRRSDGAWIYVRHVVEPLEGPSDARARMRWFNTLQEVTEQKRVEEKIRRLTRVHAVLSGINSLIVRESSRDSLLHEACRIAVDAGAFKLAWIGAVDHEAKRIKVVASEGSSRGYVESMPLEFSEDTEQGRDLVGRAVRENVPMISNNIEEDPQVLLRKQAIEHGFRSLAILPLMVSGQVAALLALYAESPGFFDDDEMKLLRELAGDISFALDHIEKAERIDYLAYYDSLTGLANRTLFSERLTQSMHAAGLTKSLLALIIVDLERFKAINDSLGRQTGDVLLKQIAERLTALRDPADIGRIGADQFAVLISGIPNEDEMGRIAQEWARLIFGRPFELGGNELHVSARAGIAVFPNDGGDAETLLRNAEAALKRAKATGARHLFYTQQMTARIAEKLSLENKLRGALDNGEFVLYYQPKVELETRRIVGAEALIRWKSPELGLVPPLQFIPLMEETGLILEVGLWVLRQAVRDQQKWIAQGLAAPRIAVNVSAIQLHQRNFSDVLTTAISEAGTPPSIDLEITESFLMEDIESNIGKLRQARDLGLGIAIDDFGTGHSSLAYLSKLPVDALKIDRSFIITMLSEPDTMTLVQTIISLAHALRLRVIAEGVDKEEQAKFLRLLRCDEMQGYLISKPLPIEEFASLLGHPGDKSCVKVDLGCLGASRVQRIDPLQRG